MIRYHLQQIANSKLFRKVILATIIISAILAGVETYTEEYVKFTLFFQFIEHLVFGLLIAEFLIKFFCHSRNLIQYFKNSWNLFDFLILTVLIFANGNHYISLLRIIRLLRSLKLLTFFPSLKNILVSLYRSIPSLGSVLIILGGLFYIYGVTATLLFGANDPVHFSSLHISLLSLFRILTLEDWTDIMYIQMFGCDSYGYEGMRELCTNPSAYPLISPLFFTSFVFLGSIIVINLFVGIITSQIMENMNR